MIETTLNSLIYLEFNTQKPPFDNVLVRQAFAFAIDKQELVDVALAGTGAPAFSPLAPTLPGFDASLANLERSTIVLNYSDNERKMSEEMYDTVEQLLHESKAETLNYKRYDWDILARRFTNTELVEWALIRKIRC